eukprot:1752811-Pleurochrysis_carterae.AAC.2
MEASVMTSLSFGRGGALAAFRPAQALARVQSTRASVPLVCRLLIPLPGRRPPVSRRIDPMAPCSQVAGTGHSFPVDHWALGILIYEMLTGALANTPHPLIPLSAIMLPVACFKGTPPAPVIVARPALMIPGIKVVAVLNFLVPRFSLNSASVLCTVGDGRSNQGLGAQHLLAHLSAHRAWPQLPQGKLAHVGAESRGLTHSGQPVLYFGRVLVH